MSTTKTSKQLDIISNIVKGINIGISYVVAATMLYRKVIVDDNKLNSSLIRLIAPVMLQWFAIIDTHKASTFYERVLAATIITSYQS